MELGTRRRDLLAASIAVIIPGASGCLDRFRPNNRARSIDLTIESVNETDSTNPISGVVSIRAEGGDDQWRTFHDVTVVGYTTDGDRLCTESLGDLRSADEPSFRLECPALPDRIVIEAEESPCVDRTYFDAAVLDGADDGERAYQIIDRTCSEK